MSLLLDTITGKINIEKALQTLKDGFELFNKSLKKSVRHQVKELVTDFTSAPTSTSVPSSVEKEQALILDKSIQAMTVPQLREFYASDEGKALINAYSIEYIGKVLDMKNRHGEEHAAIADIKNRIDWANLYGNYDFTIITTNDANPLEFAIDWRANKVCRIEQTPRIVDKVFTQDQIMKGIKNAYILVGRETL